MTDMTITDKVAGIAAACENCRFSMVHDKQGGALFCHRYPPQLISYSTLNGDIGCENHWPCLSHDDWCGEHQPGQHILDEGETK